GAHKPEGMAYLIFQETLVGEVQFHGAVGEQYEGRRGDVGLRKVENAHALPYGDRGAVEVDGLQKAIHFTRSDAFLAFASDFFEQGKNPINVLAGGGRDEEYGRVVQELQGTSQAFKVDLLVLGSPGILDSRGPRLTNGPTFSTRHEVPLVDEDD